MPASKDPDKRARQLANLNPNAAVQHRATSTRAIAARRQTYLDQLAEQFEGEDERLLLAMATRLARLDLLLEYEGKHGPILNRRTGEIRPASELAEKVTGAMERQLERLERRKAAREETAKPDARDTLAAITAELAEGGDQAHDDGPVS